LRQFDYREADPDLTDRLGTDLVMHSATKYLNGYNDVLGSALIAARDDERWAKMKETRSQFGMLLGPMEAWLLLR